MSENTTPSPEDIVNQINQVNPVSDSPEIITNGEEEVIPDGQIKIEVDIDKIKNTRVHFAVPMYGGQCTESFFTSMIKWANTAHELGIQWTMETLVNESLISRGRNTLTAKFLAMPESTHLMWVDADIGFEPWHILVLLDRDVDVIGGIYYMKNFPVTACINSTENGETGSNGLVEVSKTGTGFMLIKKHVFEKLNGHPSVKPYKNDISLDPMYDQFMKTYFDTCVRQGRYYSEDWKFCEDWRDLGGKIWVDTRVLLRHSGSIVFCQENEDRFMNEYGKKFIERETNAGNIEVVYKAEQPK